jgi:Holliday junction resolvase-like predicted endonuclease
VANAKSPRHCESDHIEPPKKHCGAQAELIASAWLLSQGYEVFRNVSQHGIADLVALHSHLGTFILIDAKSEAEDRRSIGGATKLTAEQKAANVRRVLVDRKTGACRWSPENVVVMKKRAT